MLMHSQIAAEHGIRFLETSAKANINIEQAFLELASAILSKTPGRDPAQQPDSNVRINAQREKPSQRCC
jgi:Ras-related protein Rab-10